MPKICVNGADIHYEEHGSSPETLVMAHGLLWSSLMFEKQIDAFKSYYRCVTFDFRGQGQSQVTRAGYDMDTLSDDCAAIIKTLGCDPCHFIGVSMGGIVGLRLALRHPETVKSLTLIGTNADAESPAKRDRYRLLSTVSFCFGLNAVASRVMPIMFGKTFLTDPERADERQLWQRRFTMNSRIGVRRALAGVINRDGILDKVSAISMPTLILVGDEDVATPPGLSEMMHSRIKGSKFEVVSGAGHTAT
ncbi:alpha/beta fold hydrolase, partial [Petrachloros mirabilis]